MSPARVARHGKKGAECSYYQEDRPRTEPRPIVYLDLSLDKSRSRKLSINQAFFQTIASLLTQRPYGRLVLNVSILP